MPERVPDELAERIKSTRRRGRPKTAARLAAEMALESPHSVIYEADAEPSQFSNAYVLSRRLGKALHVKKASPRPGVYVEC